MIRECFSFKGVVGRRGFLVRALAIGLTTFVLLLILMLGMEAVNGTVWRTKLSPAPYQTAEALVVASVTFIPCMWASLALMAKRLRSIGLQPTVFIILFFALGFLEGSLFLPVFRRFGLIGFYGLVALRVWDVLYLSVLFLWPQKSSLDQRTVAAATFA